MRSLVALLVLACAAPLLAQPGPAGDTPRPEAAARAAELLATAETTRQLGGRDQAAAALVDYEQAAAWAAQGRASEIYARARLGKSLALTELGQPGEAASALEEAVATARSAKLRDLLIELLERDAELAEEMGLLGRAVRNVREVSLIHDELGRTEGAVSALLRLAELELARDGGRAAAPALQAALERARAAGLPEAMEAALEAQVELALATGDADTARRAAEELLALRSDSPNEASASSLALLGRTMALSGERWEALPILEDAARACAEAGDRACEADAREVLAASLLELDRPQEAVQQVLALIGARRSLGDGAGELRAHFALAQAFVRLDRLEPALSALSEAERLSDDAAPPPVRAALRVERARLLERTRRVIEAADAWDDAIELASLPDDGRDWPDAPTLLLALPSRERLVREQLDFLVEAGLWARALVACAECNSDSAGGGLSLESLRELTLTQDATLLTWRALDDSLLGWALTTDGRLLGARVEGLGARALAELSDEVRSLAPLVELPPPGERGGEAQEELQRKLRRLQDALVSPLEPALPAESEGLLVLAPPQLEGLPWGLLIDPDGERLGQRFGIAELPGLGSRLRRAGAGTTRLVADLRDPEHPGMDLRRLVARLDGEQRRRADAARAAKDEPDRSRSRSAPGRRRPAGPPPLPPPPGPLAGERSYEDGLVVLGGAEWVPERLAALAPEASMLMLHADCSELEPPALDGALVVLPSCWGEPAETAAKRLLASGARSVLVLRWDPGDSEREGLAAGLLSVLGPGIGPAEGLRAAGRAGLPSRSWGALRLLGSAR